MPGVNVSLAAGYTGAAAIATVTAHIRIGCSQPERVTSPRLGRKSGQDCQRWIKRSVAHPFLEGKYNERDLASLP